MVKKKTWQKKRPKNSRRNRRFRLFFVVPRGILALFQGVSSIWKVFGEDQIAEGNKPWSKWPTLEHECHSRLCQRWNPFEVWFTGGKTMFAKKTTWCKSDTNSRKADQKDSRWEVEFRCSLYFAWWLSDYTHGVVRPSLSTIDPLPLSFFEIHAPSEKDANDDVEYSQDVPVRPLWGILSHRPGRVKKNTSDRVSEGLFAA